MERLKRLRFGEAFFYFRPSKKYRQMGHGKLKLPISIIKTTKNEK
jgi:hypothetical protein